MGSGQTVVDISSDEEADDRVVSEFVNQLIGNKGREDANNFVDLDYYFNSVEKSASLRPRNDSDDDCLILDGDPDKSVAADEDKRSGGDVSDDLCIVGQKGQIACRDFPHSRHLCANFPFSTSSHKLFCNLCHCFVCDSPAPCIYWGDGVSSIDHCHATDKEERWKVERKSFKKKSMVHLLPQKVPVVKHLAVPPIQNRQPIYKHIPVPTPKPIQPFKAGSLHPCSKTNTSTMPVPTQKPHQDPVYVRRQTIPQLPSQRSQPVQRVNHVDVALSGLSRTQFKRAGTPGPGIIRSSASWSQHTASVPNQMLRTMPRTPRIILQTPQIQPVTSVGSQRWTNTLPRSHSMPVQRSVCAPVTTQATSQTTTPTAEEDSIKQWQDILAGVAAELGVSDSISKSTVASQPYVPSSQSANFDASSIQCPLNADQNMSMHSDLGPAAVSPHLTEFDSWLQRSAGHDCCQRGEGGDAKSVQMQPSVPFVSMNNERVSGDLDLESLLAAVGETAPLPGKDSALPEMDPALFLHDLDCSWGGIANV